MRIVFTVTESNGMICVHTRSVMVDADDQCNRVPRVQLFSEMRRLSEKYANRPEAPAVLFEID